jgi:hypothetical protein
VNNGTVRKQGGTGTAVFNGIPFTNTGTVEIVQGVLQLTGDYTPGSNAVLRTYINGPASSPDYGRLNVGGTATLAGALVAVTVGGYVPPAGSDYSILTAAAVLGTFSEFTSSLNQDTLLLNPVYGPTGVRLRMVDPTALLGDTWRSEPDGAFHCLLHGVAAELYRIDVSTDLKTWGPLTTVVVPASTVLEFVDLQAAGVPVRYYRVTFVPGP